MCINRARGEVGFQTYDYRQKVSRPNITLLALALAPSLNPKITILGLETFSLMACGFQALDLYILETVPNLVTSSVWSPGFG